MMDLRKLQADPSEFRKAVLIDTDAGPIPFSQCMEDWQQLDFEALDDGWKRAIMGTTHKARFQRSWLERPRGHSKSQDIAMMAAWALFASRRQISGYAGAGDLDQARILRDAIGKLLHINPWLAQVLDVQNYRIINEHTGSKLEIISSDAPTSYGLTPDFVICDEVCHWPKRDLFDSLLSSAAKRSACMMVCISNAGLMDDWQWELREDVRQAPEWYFSRLDGPQASWITPDRLAEQERLLPKIAYQRLWLNEWTTGSADWVSPEDLEFAFKNDLRPQTQAEPGYTYVGGLDLGISRDASAVCILGIKRAYEGHGRIRLAYTKVWRPEKNKKVDLTDVENTLIDLHRRFDLQCLNYDPWQAEHMAQRLQAGGLGIQEQHLKYPTDLVPMRQVYQGGSNLQQMASVMCQAFADRRVDLYEHNELKRDLTLLRVEERSYGFRLVAPHTQHGHCDLGGSAFPLAMLAAAEIAGEPEPPEFVMFDSETSSHGNVSHYESVLKELHEHEDWLRNQNEPTECDQLLHLLSGGVRGRC